MTAMCGVPGCDRICSWDEDPPGTLVADCWIHGKVPARIGTECLGVQGWRQAWSAGFIFGRGDHLSLVPEQSQTIYFDPDPPVAIISDMPTWRLRRQFTTAWQCGRRHSVRCLHTEFRKYVRLKKKVQDSLWFKRARFPRRPPSSASARERFFSNTGSLARRCFSDLT